MKRFREFGFNPGKLPIGPTNSITDVPAVTVGHVTKIEGNDVRTGVTVIDPGITNLFNNKIPAAIAVGNGYGKITGTTQVEELGTLEAPIALTNTLAVGTVLRAVVEHVIVTTPSWNKLDSVNVVVGEVNDGRLNDMTKPSIMKADVDQAIANLSKNVTMGNVGAGTGSRAFSWKGGIGTSSRVVNTKQGTYTFGALVQTNFGGSLSMMGVPIGTLLKSDDFNIPLPGTDGSCMIVLATDAPLTSRQLKRIASRSFLGLARTGSIMAHSSGDYAVAFSTSQNGVEGQNMKETLEEKELSNFFLACTESVEESVYDALFAAETLSGLDGSTLSQLSKEKVIELLNKYAPK